MMLKHKMKEKMINLLQFSIFAYVCKTKYGFNIGECGTVDEMLLKFRVRYGFRQNVTSKPGGYGIKFWVLHDSANHDCYKIIPHLGIKLYRV